MRFRRLFTALASFALAAGLAHAGLDSVDFGKVIPAPPADDSPAGMADLETVLNVQKYRTKEQESEAKRVDSQSAFGFARPVFGEWFRSGDFPKTKEIMNELGGEANKVCNAAKSHWNRQRPYQRDTRVKPVTGHPGNASYPSGHTFGAAISAIIYSAAFPEYKEQFDEQVHRTMWGRVMAGVHYPSDTTAAYILAAAVGKEMLKDPGVQQKVREIRAEILKKKPQA